MADYSKFFDGFNWANGHFRGPGGGRGHGRGRGVAAMFGVGGPFPFGNFPWGGQRRGPRAKRGDIRAAILALLAEAPRNGYQIMQELEQRSRGMWRPSPGSVYPALQQLEDEGLVRAREEGAGRVFELTEPGRKYVAEHGAETEAPWDWATSESDEDLFELFGQIRQIGTALWQIAHSGQPAQLAQARKVLSDARRALYAILSQDPDGEE